MPSQTTKVSSNGSAKKSTPKTQIIVRRGHFYEASKLGRIAARTYYDTPLVDYLSPYKDKYYSHYERGFIQRSWRRMLEPRNVTFVAVSASDPSTPLGYTQVKRLGTDEGAKRYIASRPSVWLALAGWLFSLYVLVIKLVVGKDKSQDPERQKLFEASRGPMDEEYWKVEGRQDRWYVQSCVVLEEWQGQGIGKKLMAEVIAKAEAENVVIGLEASPPGENLYRSVGFDLLGRFSNAQGNFGEEDVTKAGGVMMYTPVKRRVRA